MSDNQSGPLGIDEAASAIGALLSPETPADDKQEPKKRNAAQADLEGEDHAEDDEDSEEPEEGDEESDDEGEPDPDEDEEEESLAAARPGKLHTVKVDGKDTQVSEAELISSYQRQADYTRKSMALAESRKANETELQALKSERQQYAHWAQQMVQQLQRQAPQEPDWNQLRQTDPVAFAAAWADHQRYREYTAGITAQYEQAMQANREAEAHQMEQVLAAEAERLNAALPEWTDKTRASKEKAALLDYGRQSGFSDDELNSVYDHQDSDRVEESDAL